MSAKTKTQPGTGANPKGTSTFLTLEDDALNHVRAHLAKIEPLKFSNAGNIRVRERWRALELALEQVESGEPLKVERQLVDTYYEVRDAVMDWAGMGAEPMIRCLVRTPTKLQFWVPWMYCKPIAGLSKPVEACVEA